MPSWFFLTKLLAAPRLRPTHDMKKINFKKINLVIILIILFLIFAKVETGSAGVLDQIKAGFYQTGKEAGYDPNAGGAPKKEFTEAWAIYVNGFAAIMSALFLVFAIYGGFLWMTAHGNEEQVTRAKNLIIQAVIGLAVIIAARLLAELVLEVLARTLPLAQEATTPTP